MTIPTTKVEIAFASNPNDATQVWTDVTEYWDASRAIQMSGGRADEFESVQAGRLTGLVLDNSDGRFTYGLAAGAYYPNVQPGKRIRISVKNSALAWKPRWDGYIDGWPLGFDDNGNRCIVTISATDRLKQIAQIGDVSLRSFIRSLPGLVGYYPMTSDLTGLGLKDQLGDVGPTLVYSAGVPNPGADYTVAEADGPPGDPTKVGRYARPTTEGLRGAYHFAPIPLHGAFSVLYAFKQTDSSVLNYAQSPLSVAYSNASYFAHYIDKATGRLASTSPAQVVTVGEWMSAALTTQDTYGSFIGLQVGGIPGTPFVGSEQCFGGNVAHIAVLDRTATSDEILNYRAIVDGYPGTAADRVAAALRIAGIDVQFSDFLADGDYATSTVGTQLNPISPSPSSLAEVIATALDSDDGILWVDRSGVFQYHSGARRRRSTTAPLILTAADIGDSLQLVPDDLKVVNRAEAVVRDRTTELGRAGRVDVGSQAMFGVRSRSLTSYARSANAFDVADSMMSGEIGWRVPSVTVDLLTTSSAIVDEVLTRADVGNLLGVTDLPAGAMLDRWVGWVEGWTETLGIDVWSIDLNLSPAGLVLGDSTFGTLNSNALARGGRS